VYFDLFLKWWDDTSTQRLDYSERLIQILREMKLDVSEEAKSVKRIQADNEAAIQGLTKWMALWKAKRGDEEGGGGLNVC
jgi:hypothetical protein